MGFARGQCKIMFVVSSHLHFNADFGTSKWIWIVAIASKFPLLDHSKSSRGRILDPHCIH